MNIIEALKQNERAFGLMHTEEFTNEEMQAKMRWLESNRTGEYIIEFYYNDGSWNPADTPQFNTNTEGTYRLRPDYTEDEYELCEIYTKGDSLCFEDLSGNGWMLEVAPRYFNFAGYLYEDGKVRSTPVIYKIGTTGWYEIEVSKFNEYEIIRPTHVVFKK